MRARRALIVHTRMPAFDRDSGSQDIDNTVRFLVDDGWRVSFLAKEEEGVAEERHANRLRQMGVSTYAGFGWAERLLRSNDFDLAIIAFWEQAARLLPLIRSVSPTTRVIVNSLDVHLLRNARRTFGAQQDLDQVFGDEAARELNTYNGADAVIAVSDKERALLEDFLGEGRAYTLPLAEDVARSPVPLEERRGMFFVGNFRHLPNREAAQYLCTEVVPLLDRALLEEHPLSIVGNWLVEADLALPDLANVHQVGWVPSVRPYLERSRVAVMPLLHGAGVKRKVIQAMMAYTPVVTTPVGAEGLDLVQGEHALIAADATDMATGITRLLTEADLWQRLAAAGADHVDTNHGVEHVRARFGEIVEQVMSGPRPEHLADAAPRALASGVDPSLQGAAAVRRRVQLLAAPEAVVLVASGGDDALTAIGSHPCWHFPEARDGGWAGYEPVDGDAALTHLEAQRVRGARYFVLPRASFSWRHRYPELFEHLEARCTRLHEDEHLVMYDLAGRSQGATLDATPGVRVLVLGTYSSSRTGPPQPLVAELATAEGVAVEQRWRADVPVPSLDGVDAEEHDYVVFVDADAILPQRFLERLVATQATLGVDRLQPTHMSGPASGPPVTERHAGSVAREVDDRTPVPVLAVRSGATVDGPTVLADQVSVGLRTRIRPQGRAVDEGYVRRVWVEGPDGRPVAHEREEPEVTPRISVLIATYERSELLRECLRSFAKQTLDRDEFEVVLIDDGSVTTEIGPLIEELGDDLRITGLRIAHAGRSAAKNHAVMLARAPIVLFFDDDDQAAPDYLERHLASHEARPQESVAILGHTDWASGITPTPLMDYITDVDRLMFAYERLGHGQELDWRGFWEGRISCKRSLLIRYGMHDQRLNYSIDVEMAWRLAGQGLRVVYDASAQSVMVRPLDVEGFCTRTQAKGKAHAIVAALHGGTEIAERVLGEGPDAWLANPMGEVTLRQRVATLEARVERDEDALGKLHNAYRELFRYMHAKGVAEATGAVPPVSEPPTTVQPFPNTDPDLAYDASPEQAAAEPVVSITIPVWSRTPELATMARATIERIWEVARVPTEVVVIDNGSPHELELPAKVYRYPENKGVATAWNTGIRLSSGPAVVVMNSDCRVEPGWDEALLEAVNDGRRVAFPYTDHCDGKGFTLPDQGGTAGWCFMLTKEIYEEVGVFDEWFNPAFLEDTDYWHRAWELGVELSPVPAARVVHARRTTASTHPRSDWLLQAHRYKYGWKHGVDPHRAPPYYNRDIVDYHGTVRPPR